ncbi:MAG: glycosyltransferase family 2 protein [Coriobacteriia bacterium]|nr:glycosyltransferase family 2 protein [Coriobacteriia bacterium]
MNVFALIPAYNEADLIGQTLAAVQSIPSITKVIVIDDGSTDGTDKIVKRQGIRLIRSNQNQGKGAALQAGAEAIRNYDFDAVLLLDADLGISASEAEYLLGPLEDDLADMIIGVLPKPAEPGGFGVVRNLARKAIRDLGGGYSAEAPLSGQRALNWKCFQAVLPFSAGYGVEVGMTITALKKNLRVYEVMVNMHHRETSRDLPGFIHRGRQYLDVHHTIHQLTKEPFFDTKDSK